MIRFSEIASTTAVAAVLSVVPISGAALAHDAPGEHVSEFQEHMSEYAEDINHLIGMTGDIAADYKPGGDYTDALHELVEQWEAAEFHEAVEDRATPLYPPIWAAIGAFSTAVKEGKSVAVVQDKADDIAAALWQGYGALKLLAAGGGAHGGQTHKAASGEAVIDTINNKLDLVLVEYKEGETEEALEIIHDTYMGYFEGIEGDLIEQNAELVSSLEVDFNATLPALIKQGAPADKVAALIDDMQEDLEQAEHLLEAAEQEESKVF